MGESAPPLEPPCPDDEAYQPQQIARRVQALGVTKAQADAPTPLVLGVLGVQGVLAGAFISLGALFFAVVVTGSELGFGPTRWLGGLAFCLGLALVVIAGAELFTGNNLLAMAWASRLLRHWGLVTLVGGTLLQKQKAATPRGGGSIDTGGPLGHGTGRQASYLVAALALVAVALEALLTLSSTSFWPSCRNSWFMATTFSASPLRRSLRSLATFCWPST